MSLDRIRRLLTDANTGSPYDAAALLELAAHVAETTQPEVQHPAHGCGVVVGVTPDGLLEVRFGDDEYTRALPVEALWEVAA